MSIRSPQWGRGEFRALDRIFVLSAARYAEVDDLPQVVAGLARGRPPVRLSGLESGSSHESRS
jgi:hypothetical protein